MTKVSTLKVPARILMGPGPSDVAPAVLQAMANPLLGHLDPAFLEIMNEIMDQLREVFGTKNQLTMPMSGTGSAGMETAFVNVINPGDVAVVGVNGVFGQRMADVAQRCGAVVKTVEAAWGEAIDPNRIEEVLRSEDKVKLVAVVHAETSTGVMQPLEDISRLAHQYGALFLVDAVTSLGGIPVEVDRFGIDICYSGTQKCISAPPGLAPVTFSQRALDALDGLSDKVQSWYLDLSMIKGYWGQERSYHHTAPISMNYALREALRLILEEGLESTYRRHQILGGALQNGLEAMGLTMHVKEDIRLPQLTVVRIPGGVEDAAVRSRLLLEYGIEIGGGLGPLKGDVWRVGLMGHACRPKNVMTFLTALESILADMGVDVEAGAAGSAARQRIAAL